MRGIHDYLAELDARIDDLAASVGGGDDRQIWAGLVESLAWLYRSELVRRKTQPEYFDLRRASETGRVLGGLIYFRGEVEHAHAEDAYVLGWVETETYIATDGGWKRVTPMVSDGTRWIETQTMVTHPVYPPLHASAKRDADGRDDWYRQSVHGRALVAPLREAASFLREIS